MINIFWFRRDLRLDDNHALFEALNSGLPVLPIFIFDSNIIDELPRDDSRVSFIHETLGSINRQLAAFNGAIGVFRDEPLSAWEKLIAIYSINTVFVNRDYEPYALERDAKVEAFLKRNGVRMMQFRDQVIFEKNDILTSTNEPYTVFTPYKNKWLKELGSMLPLRNYTHDFHGRFFSSGVRFPTLQDLGFKRGSQRVRPFDLTVIRDYHKFRDFPADDRTSYLGPHLRFGTLSIRRIVDFAMKENAVFLGELIWREFFMQILFHFPHAMTCNFRSKYDGITWRNDENEFRRWCAGETGYPIVDAGMRQLNETGYMHNRVRMITAGFLCKHLLIDWRWGEAFFAGRLLDYELSSNNGNWQWAAGTGCDAAPYFRVFNPLIQQKKFDPREAYVKKWVPEMGGKEYPAPVVEHNFARDRAVKAYKKGLEESG
jgi:deoxyribodipyrimidine photo-lyase